jgi:hypothetical protein
MPAGRAFRLPHSGPRGSVFLQEIGLVLRVKGFPGPSTRRHRVKCFALQFFRVVDMAFREKQVCQVDFDPNVSGYSGPRVRD